MILTFLDPKPDPNDPYSSRLFFYAITTFPIRLAEGILLYDTISEQIIGIKTQEFPVVTTEDVVETLLISLFTRGLLNAFATHKHHGLTNNLLDNSPGPSAAPYLRQ